MNWYAIRTQNNHEKSVLEKLKLELSKSGLSDKLGRHIIPMEKSIMVRNGKKIQRDKIVYPGYLFLETSAVGEINNALRNIKGAAGFVRSKSGEVSPLKDSEISKIYMEEDSKMNSTAFEHSFTRGDLIKITDGPFSDFKATIDDIDTDRQKVKVSVNIFSRATPLELDFTQIEKF